MRFHRQRITSANKFRHLSFEKPIIKQSKNE